MPVQDRERDPDDQRLTRFLGSGHQHFHAAQPEGDAGAEEDPTRLMHGRLVAKGRDDADGRVETHEESAEELTEDVQEKISGGFLQSSVFLLKRRRKPSSAHSSSGLLARAFFTTSRNVNDGTIRLFGFIVY